MPYRILVIEHDPSIASLLSYPLAQEGYSVTCVNRGSSGLSELKKRLYDMAVCDIDHAADEFSIFMHSLQQCLIDVPILVLSSNPNEADIAACLRSGAEDYIVKPFGVEHFLARIYAILRRGRKCCMEEEPFPALAEETAIEVGNLHIFPEKYEVSVSGTKLTLPSKEFELLLRLAEHKGAVVSKNDLAHLLGPAVNPKSCRKVDVYVSSIRKKFRPFDGIRIEAVRGRGYKLVGSMES
ncbi:hypothetical protein SD70_11525 [Gordoniibacillus kamchatkensis]|uniref:DNA-binding response regulator n=1 Tax=Gordoniibacillus kamchatkensis TaxID=1590651 RepID=A0ABR5AI33_9BACL|nr:hypothetical protein SD70_11525 [Paenibacillus sp. VKM B-2647]